jgi:large subunit ribosomal protein L13
MDKNTTIHTIDATDKKLGRLASEISILLLGKNKPEFQKYIAAAIKVQVVKASQLSIDQKKLKEKEYIRYTGYPGGLRKEPLERLVKRHGYSEALRRAVYGMLPSNKLRAKRMKNLFIEE